MEDDPVSDWLTHRQEDREAQRSQCSPCDTGRRRCAVPLACHLSETTRVFHRSLRDAFPMDFRASALGIDKPPTQPESLRSRFARWLKGR